MTDLFDAAEPIIRRVARRLAAETPGLDPDDIGQEIWSAVYADAARFPDPDAEDFAQILTYRATRAGNAYCRRERFYWQHNAAEWIYTPREVRAVLQEFYGDPTGWEDAPKRDTGQSITGDGISILLMDLHSAVDKLPESDQALLIRRYVAGERFGNDSPNRKKVDRAIDRVTEILNGNISQRFDYRKHDGPGSRHGCTNAAARARQANDYDGQG